MMSATSAMLAQNTSREFGWSRDTHNGTLSTAIIELRDTYPVSQRQITHTGIASSTATGASARNIPAAVATPLPPLRLTYGENMCPRTAAPPNATGIHGHPAPAQPEKNSTGIAPFAMSIRATGIAYFQPRMR